MKNVLAMVLAGGVGERLHPLTRNRAKPAVPFGGIYRIIDFTLTNCINSECRQIAVLVQYKSNSLARHVQYAWDMCRREFDEFIDVIPPQMRVNHNWYLGTADAIYQNLYSVDQAKPDEVLILSGDHIYKMDYGKKIHCHRQHEADLTISAIEVPLHEAHRFGVLEVDETGKVIGFEEKPDHPKPLPHRPDHALASMGIYAFNTDVLRHVLIEDAEHPGSCHDFGKDIIPRMLDKYAVYAHYFEDENKKATQYWRDVGTLDAYWEAHMDLVAVDPIFNLYDKSWPLRTRVHTLPPAKSVFGDTGDRFGAAIDSMVSPGCIISGGTVRRTVLGPECRINSYSQVDESILFAGASIGRHCRIRRAIIEKGVAIPDHTVIGYDTVADARKHRVSEGGIVVVDAPPPRTSSMSAPVWPLRV